VPSADDIRTPQQPRLKRNAVSHVCANELIRKFFIVINYMTSVDCLAYDVKLGIFFIKV
jgi:hypothetical protein